MLGSRQSVQLSLAYQPADQPYYMPDYGLGFLPGELPIKSNEFPEDHQEDRQAYRPASGSRLHLFIAVSIASIGAFGAGAMVGWAAAASEIFYEHTATEMQDMSWAVSIVNLGAAVAMPPTAALLRRCGRRAAMLWAAPGFSASWLALALASAAGGPGVVASRFAVGLFAGVFYVAVPMYNGEVTEDPVRGAVGNFFQLFMSAGLVATFLVGFSRSVLALSLFGAAVPAVLFAALWCVPESPSYLVKVGDEARARAALRWLRGADYDVSWEVARIRSRFVESVGREGESLLENFRSHATKRAILIIAGVMVMRQLSGINPVVTYAVVIFRDAKDSMDPYVSTIIAGSVLVAATGLSTLLVDRFARRTLLLVSAALTALGHLAVGLYFHMTVHYPESAASVRWLPLVGLCSFLATHTTGFGAVTWIFLGEMLPVEVKEIAGPICVCLNFLTAFMVSKCFPDWVHNIGYGTSFWVLASLCFLGLLFVIFFVIETKGKTLEQIREELDERCYLYLKFIF